MSCDNSRPGAILRLRLCRVPVIRAHASMVYIHVPFCLLFEKVTVHRVHSRPRCVMIWARCICFCDDAETSTTPASCERNKPTHLTCSLRRTYTCPTCLRKRPRSRLAANRPSVQILARGIRAVERSTHLQRLLPTWQGHQRTITYTCGPTVSRSSDLYTPSAAAHKGRQRWTKYGKFSRS